MTAKIKAHTVAEPRNVLAIRRILVKKLFGLYSYDLRCEAPFQEASKLLILYGDNGSGKTTILSLLFNLLTHIDKQGHKTILARTRFKEISVDLGKDTRVSAQRKGKALIGSYTAFVKRRGKIISAIHFKANKDLSVSRPSEGGARYEARLRHFLGSLADLKLALFLITDTRQLLQNLEPRRPVSPDAPVVRAIAGLRLRGISRPRGMDVNAGLSQAITFAVEWAKEQVLSGSKQGEADANTIYADIVQRLAGASPGTKKIERTNIRKLIETLREQGARSEDFARFGFPSALNITDLITALAKARNDLSTIYKIVVPFVDTTRAKLDALQEVQNSVSGFVSTLNSFFKDKSVEFDLRTGISVTASNGATLAPTALSSGEKQLLLLFCNTLITKNETTIFLIDEPELSLNIKWQRNLIRSLLDTTKKRTVQFVLATHSFELFAPHEKNVLELVDYHHATKQRATTTKPKRTDSNP
jgi:energy-coupling factor transporter ATP-binding protein EcfA2